MEVKQVQADKTSEKSREEHSVGKMFFQHLGPTSSIFKVCALYLNVVMVFILGSL